MRQFTTLLIITLLLAQLPYVQTEATPGVTETPWHQAQDAFPGERENPPREGIRFGLDALTGSLDDNDDIDEWHCEILSALCSTMPR